MSERIPVAKVGEIGPGKSKKFHLDIDGRDVECFLVRWGEGHYAYVNRCRHVSLEMDWVENRFFDRDGRYLLCPTHCALYEPDTGECVFGPPVGRRLFRVPLEVTGETIYAITPDDFVP